MTKQEVLAKNLVDQAIEGDWRAAKVLLPFLARAPESEEANDPEDTPEDRELLEDYVNRQLNTDGSPNKPSDTSGQ